MLKHQAKHHDVTMQIRVYQQIKYKVGFNLETITSVQNILIKETKKLKLKKYREQTGLFLLEGIRLAEEALKAGSLEHVFFTGQLLESKRGRILFEAISNDKSQIQIHEVSEEVLKIIAETETPQGIVGTARKRQYSLSDLQDVRESIIITADGISDPGNLGAMIRTAWAAGVTALVCLEGTADPFNSKTVRSSMGGIFHLPVITNIKWDELCTWSKKRGYFLTAGVLEGSELYYEAVYKPKTMLIIGSEASGLVSVNADELDSKVRIPLEDGAESLNAAVACGIILFEIKKQLS